MVGIDAAERFMGAFRAIEKQFRHQLNDENSGFKTLAYAYADKFNMRTVDLRLLVVCADLRNAIVHEKHFNGKPIAQPNIGIVEIIEALRRKITQPATVWAILERRPVVVFAPEDPVRSVLDGVRKHNYSQFPIYDKGRYRGLLTTNCIGRWLADRLTTDELAESESVESVLKFAEPQDSAVHLPRTATALHAIKCLSTPAPGTATPAALIITQTGKRDESPLALVVAEDMGALFKAA